MSLFPAAPRLCPGTDSNLSADREKRCCGLRLLFLALLVFLVLGSQAAWAGIPVRAAIMMNMTTGRILYQKNADKAIPPASLTKLMTSFLVHDAIAAGRLSMGTKVRIPREAARVGGSSMHLRTGERVTVAKLLQGTLISSGNDAATALALKVSGRQKHFVDAMNTKAARLGMKRTRFRNPTGLPAAGQVTTARDMMRLSLAYMARYPRAAKISSLRTYYHRGRPHNTTNPFLGTRGVNGLKTGFTLSSGYNIILTTQRGQNKLLIVLLGASSKYRRAVAAQALLDAGLRYPNSATQVRKLIDGKSKRQLTSKQKISKPKKYVAKKKKRGKRTSSAR